MDIIEKFREQAEAEYERIKSLVKNGSTIYPDFKASVKKYDFFAEKVMVEFYGTNFKDLIENNVEMHTANAKLKEISINDYAQAEDDFLKKAL